MSAATAAPTRMDWNANASDPAEMGEACHGHAVLDLLHEFLGSKVAPLRNPISRRMVYELMVRSRTRALSERVYR